MTEDDDLPPAPPSKTQRKNDAHDLRKLGEELVDLPAGKLSKLDLPDELRAAIEEARRLGSRPARNRQLQIVGRLMQDVDATALRAAIRAVDHLPRAAGAGAAAPASSGFEELAERLLDGGDAAVFALGDRYSREQLQTLRQAVRQAQKKLQGGADRAVASKLVADCLVRLRS
jgi:ribosome-associated protein